MGPMKWEKLGKIFDPTQHILPNDCLQFAQSPQTLVFDDFVRIYFSTRAVDKTNGKYLSHIAFVDMRKNLREVIRVSDKTVIPLGGLGSFDEHGIFPMNVVRHGDAVYGYTCGWNRRVSVSVDTAIGLVISRDDGLTFQRMGDGPVLAASLHEPCLVGDGFVKVIGDVFHMWYIFGTGWKKYSEDVPPDRTYKIGHAVSNDGINWVKEEARQIVADRLGADESQALPTVVRIDGRYHMFFCYRQSFDFRKNKDRGYRIGHAWSDDLANWTRDDDNPFLDITPGDWDADMMCYPHVFECDGAVYLLYNGNEFGRYGFGLAVLKPRQMIDYRLNHASENEIAEHLRRCDADFMPPLSGRVDIVEYTSKIAGDATRFEAWSDGTLIGLVAAYCNDWENGVAYVTSVSVLDEWTSRGIAGSLMAQCIEHVKALNMRRIDLEVAKDNSRAIKLYMKRGFVVVKTDSAFAAMELLLKRGERNER